MAIVVGDIHGNVEKVKAFLAHKPGELHIALGDYVDSFYEPLKRQIESLQLLLDSDAVLLWGNHDLHYLRDSPWTCTGFQNPGWEQYTFLIQKNLHRFKAAYEVDGWLLTHGGVHADFVGAETDVSKIADLLNAEFAVWAKAPENYQRINSISHGQRLFNISAARGGSSPFSGIFWFDFKRDSGLAPVKQIFGHTETPEPVVTANYVALDTTNNKTDCWLYDTAANELVGLKIGQNMHEEIIDGVVYKVVGRRKPLDNNPRRIRDLPKDEQGPFKAYLYLKNCPLLDGVPPEEQHGYWPADYRRWKPEFEAQKNQTQPDDLDRAIERLTEIMNMDFMAKTPAERLEIGCEVAEINQKFDAVPHDCELGTLLDALEDIKTRRDNTPRIRNLPLEEKEPFRQWLMGQCCPGFLWLSGEDRDFYYENDYQRWKRHPNSWEHDE